MRVLLHADLVVKLVLHKIRVVGSTLSGGKSSTGFRYFATIICTYGYLCLFT